MRVRITRGDLTSRDACYRGLEWFDSAAVGGIIEGQWTRDTQLMCIALGAGRWWGWAVSVGLLPAWCMAGAELRGADLRWADFTGAHLTEADLAGADLTGAILTGAYIDGVDFRGASLQWADLSTVDLTGADLTGADLTGAERLPTDHVIPGWEVRGGLLVRA